MRTGNGKDPLVVRETGAALRAWRRRRGLTQHELASRLTGGYQGSSVSGWERGEYDPRPSAVIELDEVLEADGAIIGLYGLVVPTEGELLSRLTSAVAKLSAELEELRAAFEAHVLAHS
jgi:transcriptional regulator with XRE-family HTH domain